MREFYPLIVIGAIIGGFALAFTIAYLTIRGNKEAIGFDRNMKARSPAACCATQSHTGKASCSYCS